MVRVLTKTLPEYNLDSRMLKQNYYRAKNKYKQNQNKNNLDDRRDKSKACKSEINKLKRKANKDFTNKIRNLKSTQPRGYWRLINNKKASTVQADTQDLFDSFKTLSSELGDNQGEEDISAHGKLVHYDNSDMNRPFTGEEVTKGYM